MASVKCILVGDSSIGKTTLLLAHHFKKYDPDHLVTTAESYTCDVTVGSKTVTLEKCDTVATEEYRRLRTMTYESMDVFILCFSLANPASLQNVKTKWLPEIRNHRASAPVILVGLKEDLRMFGEDAIRDSMCRYDTQAVGKEEGLAMARNVGARAYVECSARLDKNVHEVFEAAALAWMKPTQSQLPKTKCVCS